MYGIYCINYNGERVHGLNIWPQAQRTSTVYTTYVENVYVCDSIPPPPLTLWLEGVVIVIASSSLLSLLYVAFFLCVLSACGVSSRTIYLPNSKPNVMSCGLSCVVYVLSWQNYFRANSCVFVRSSFGITSEAYIILNDVCDKFVDNMYIHITHIDRQSVSVYESYAETDGFDPLDASLLTTQAKNLYKCEHKKVFLAHENVIWCW